MKKIFTLFLWTSMMFGFISCSDDEPTPTSLMNIQKINNRFATKIFSFDGMKLETKDIEFKFLNGTPLVSDVIHEAELELCLAANVRTSTVEDRVYEPIRFNVHAVSAEDKITFSGESLQGAGNVKHSVEGVYQKASPNDTLYVNLKRESPQAVFAGKTYELILDNDAWDLNDFANNKPTNGQPILEQVEKGIPFYMEYLRDKTGTTSYLFSFQTDGTIDIQKYNRSNDDYEAVPGRFKYYVADNELGFIEMEIESATRLRQLLTGNDRVDVYFGHTFYSTYLFNNVITMTFSYRMTQKGLYLAIGDKFGTYAMKEMLLQWQETMGVPNYTNGSEPFSPLYISWGQKENRSDQLWWKLEEYD